MTSLSARGVSFSIYFQARQSTDRRKLRPGDSKRASLEGQAAEMAVSKDLLDLQDRWLILQLSSLLSFFSTLGGHTCGPQCEVLGWGLQQLVSKALTMFMKSKNVWTLETTCLTIHK